VSDVETPLGGGWSTEGVVRVGDTVRRPSIHATQSMRDVLVHLEQLGFDAAPRWRGVDDRGRDVLTFIEGETYSDCRALVWSDGQLAASAGLLRRYHDAVAGSTLAGRADVVCHGDFGPWNLIWRDGLPVAIIDFDNAHPGDRLEDIGYALRAHLNLGLVDLPPSEQARRVARFLGAYPIEVDARALLARTYDAAEARCRANGWLSELAGLDAERAWLAASAL
jgi:tRNA A-37 threonylcarbamoyl transferase component Bud32